MILKISSAALAMLICAGAMQAAATPGSTGALAPLKSNPYYFQDAKGKPVWVAGDSTGAFSSYEFDYATCFDTLKANGLNFCRTWVCKGRECSPDGKVTFYLAYQRPGPGIAKDGKPKCDLTKFNPAFFERLKAVCQAAKDRGIYLHLILLDAWNIKNKAPFGVNVYNLENNINGVDADVNKDGDAKDPGEFCSLTNTGVLNVQKAFIKKVIDEVNHFDNIIFEIANENYYSKEWELYLCDYVKLCEKGKPVKHMVMPKDLPHHDYADIKTWNLPKLHAELLKARNLKQPLIWCTDGIGEPDDSTVRKAVWTVFTSGGHADYLDSSLSELGKNPTRPEMRAQYGYVAAFVKKLRFWEMTPDDGLVKSGSAYAIASKNELVAFLPSGGEVTLDLTKMNGKLSARWFDPRTGKYNKESQINGGGLSKFKAPDETDWALLVRKQGTAK